MNGLQAVPDGVVSKAQFAEICGVHKSRVSHWIADGKLTGDALVGQGREQRIHAETAKAQLRRRLDVAQMTGNGLGTQLKPSSAAAHQTPAPALETAPPPPGESIQDKIAIEILETKRLQRQRLEEEAFARSGRWTDAAAAKLAMGRIAGDMVAQIEGELPDLATDLAVQFNWPQRDVLHALRSRFRSLRERLAARDAQKAAELPEFIEFIESETLGDSSAEIAEPE